MDQNSLYKVGDIFYFRGVIYEICYFEETKNKEYTACCYELNNNGEQTGRIEWVLEKDIIDIIPKPYEVGNVLYVDNDNGLDIVSFKFSIIVKNWLYILEDGDLTTHDDIINQGGKLYFTKGLVPKNMLNSEHNQDTKLDTQANNNQVDMVNSPPHYTQFPMQLKDWNFAVIETMKDKHWAAYFKTVSEYLHRAHLKNGVQDLEKAIFWLQDAVDRIKNNQFEVK